MINHLWNMLRNELIIVLTLSLENVNIIPFSVPYLHAQEGRKSLSQNGILIW